MKKIIITLFFVANISFSVAQDVSVEKSTWGIQTGPIGFWFHNETKISNQIALRSEIGLEYERLFFIGDIVAPVVTLEPRWYYNLDNRVSKTKSISGNSGNYFFIETSFYPPIVLISNSNNVNGFDRITIIPSWGMKRNIGSHFNYELGAGFGYRYFLSNNKMNIRLITT